MTAARYDGFVQISYGPGAHQFGEFRPTDTHSRGIIMVIHGGFWRAHRSLEMTAPLAEALQARGFDTWNIEYRRVGHGSWSETLHDVAAAFEHVNLIEQERRLGAARIFLLGHSAGGHLAAWCAGLAARRRGDGSGHSSTVPARIPVRGLVTAGAVLDLAAAARAGTGEDAVIDFLGGFPEEVPDRYTAADPIQRVPTGVPTRCLHSVNDQRVPLEQSRGYVHTACAAGDDAHLITGTGPHAEVLDPETRDFELVAGALDELASTKR